MLMNGHETMVMLMSDGQVGHTLIYDIELSQNNGVSLTLNRMLNKYKMII